MRETIYNSLDPSFKTPFGAVPEGTQVTFRLSVPDTLGCTTPYLCICRWDEPVRLLAMQPAGKQGGRNLFRLEYTAGQPGAYFYFFDLYVNYTKIFRGERGEGYLSSAPQGDRYQLTVYERDFATPAPLRGGVLYQIFPDRFCEGTPHTEMPFADRYYRKNKDGEPYFWPNEVDDGLLNLDYFGGDFAGIESKLPYLASLGVTLIYLNPIFEAHSNHRYNTADYMKPDPLLGTEADFVRLCAKAKAQGIRIILDGVFSHTGSDSVYFDREARYGSNGAYHNPNSPYRCWYDFSPQYRDGYRSWWGFDTLPEVNENEPSFQKFICGEGGVIDHWMTLGASGFRLDVADELPDDFIQLIRAAVKRHGEDKLLIGEVWEDATNKVSYGVHRAYLLGGGLDTVMNYPFRDAIIRFLRAGNAAALAEVLMSIVEHYPKPAMDVAMNMLSTHDTVRAITAIAGEDCEGHDRYWQSGRVLDEPHFFFGKRLMRLGFCLIFTLPGLPCIYYGDEIAMQGYKDPFNRAYFDWNCTDETLRRCVRELAARRRSNPAFADGDLRILRAEGGLLVFERRSGSHSATVVINRSQAPVTLTLAGAQHTLPEYSYLLLDEPAGL